MPLLSSESFTRLGQILLVWLLLDFVIMGIACQFGWSRLFTKRANGVLGLPGWIFFGPLLGYTWIFWTVLRVARREPACNKVTSNLWVGRRLLPHEVPETFAVYLDLTAEFTEPRAIRNLPSYRCFPILDTMAPTPEALRQEINSLPAGIMFVHCAMGHGRTGLFAAALLLYRGEASSVEESLTLLQRARPGIALKDRQRRCLEAFHASLVASSPSPH